MVQHANFAAVVVGAFGLVLLFASDLARAETEIRADHGIGAGGDIFIGEAQIGRSPKDIQRAIDEVLAVSGAASASLERAASALGMGRCQLAVALSDPARASRPPAELRAELARLAAERDRALASIEQIPLSTEEEILDRRAALQALARGDQSEVRSIVAYYGIAAGGDVKIDTYVAGWSEEDVTLLQRTVTGFSQQAADTVSNLRSDLQLSECAVRSLLRALGEKNVAPTDYLKHLPIMARRYRLAIEEVEQLALEHPELYRIAQEIVRAREDGDDDRQRELSYRLSDMRLDAAGRDIARSGLFALSQLKFEKAAKDFERAANRLSDVDAVEAPQLIETRAGYLTSAGIAWQEGGSLERAEPLLREALGLLRDIGASDVHIARALNDLAFLELTRNRLGAAETFLEQAWQVAQAVEFPSDIKATTLAYLAQLKQRRGDYVDATAKYESAIQMLESAYETNDIRLAPLLCNAAEVRWVTDDFDGARGFYERALALIPEVNVGGRLAKRSCQNGLASLHWRQRNYAEAIEIFAALKALVLTAFAPTHPEVAVFGAQLGQVLVDAGEFDKAQTELERALDLAEKTLDAAAVTTIRNNLGALYFRRQAYTEAAEMFRVALRDTLDQLGPSHPAVAVRRANLARALEKLNEPALAEAQFREALQILQRVLGPGDLETISVTSMLSSFYARQERWSDAIKVHEQTVQALRGEPNGTRQLALPLMKLGDVLFAAGQRRQAEAAYSEALPLLESSYGRDDRHTRHVRGRLSDLDD